MNDPDETSEHRGMEGNDSPRPVDYEARYRRLVENSNDLIVDIDLNGVITSVNPGTQRLTGYSPEDLLGTYLPDYLAPGESERLIIEISRLVGGEEFTRTEYAFIGKTGERFVADVSAYPIKENGLVVGIEGIGRDVTEHHVMVEALTYQAVHDPLTGLANRATFFEHLENALARARRASSSVAVILLDLDGFKEVNDDLGHAAGDVVLVSVAQRLTRDLRQGEGLMRLGGDEFVVIVEGAEMDEELSTIARRIVDAISEPIATGESDVSLTSSLGIARSRFDDDPNSLLRRADLAMYEVKAARRTHRSDPSTSWLIDRP